MTALTDWICATPRRLGVILAAALGLLVGGGLLLTPNHPASTVRPAEPLVPPVTVQAAMDTANAFVQSWCELDGRTPEQWADDLRERSTPNLAKEWAPAMASALTGDCPWLRSGVRWISPTAALVSVLPKSTNALLVTVVQDHGRLAVSAFGPDVGGD